MQIIMPSVLLQREKKNKTTNKTRGFSLAINIFTLCTDHENKKVTFTCSNSRMDTREK